MVRLTTNLLQQYRCIRSHKFIIYFTFYLLFWREMER